MRRAGAAVAGLRHRAIALAAGLTQPQRRALAIVAVAVMAAALDAVLRRWLPTGLGLLLPLALSMAGSALLLRRSRPQTAATAQIAAIVTPAAAVVPFTPPPHDARPSAAVLDRSIGELGQFPIFTDIVTSQLASVVTLSDGAAHGIMTSLAAVDSEVTTLMTMIRTSDAGVAVGDIVGDIETKVAACSRRLDQFHTRQAETGRLEAALRIRLEADSQAVLRIVAGVRRIAQQSNILSFNIAIEAGHLGSKDNGFSFIADQVRRLAQDVDSLAEQLSSQLGTIMHSVIVESQVQAAERHAAEGGDITALSAAIAGLDGDFRTLVDHQRDMLAKVASGSEAVAAPILAMMGSVQFQDITRQQIEQLTLTVSTVGTRVAGIASMLRDATDEPDAPDLSQLLDGLFSGYVMDGQRGAHLAAKGGEAEPPSAGLLIELF